MPVFGIRYKCFVFSLCLGLLFSSSLNVKAQSTSFPVSVTTFVNPPFSVFFEDYTSPVANLITTQIRLNDESEFIYTMYSGDGKHHYLSVYPENIVYDQSFYGFYENCDPQILSDLKSEGTGKYFFIIDDHELEDDGSAIISRRLDCWSVYIDNYRDRAYYEPDSLYLHFGRRAILDYVKVDRLPERLVTYLKEEQPEVYEVYLNLTDQEE